MKLYFENDRIRIRDMTAADGPVFVTEELAQGWHASIGKYETRLRHQAEGKAVVLTAEYDGQPAGYVSVYRKAENGPFAGSELPEIVDLGVLQKYQRQGIGKALMDAAEAVAAGYSDTVCLAVGLHSGYGSAQRLYVQRGYLPDGSGAWYGDRICPQYAACCNDDDFVLYLSKNCNI